MSLFAVIRHAPTLWSEAGRLQGRSDPPLSPRGAAAARRWRVPPELDGFSWAASPLARARATARLLGVAEFSVEPALVEMAWGEWEGSRLAELRAEFGAAMAAREAAGLEFRAPSGESPREVAARLGGYLARLAAAGKPVAAVTHKGVIRALLALATGWDMRGKPPHRLLPAAAHLFRLDPAGRPAIERLNLPLAAP
ncbi:MAG TPA: histidine phosphatase family protein [Stellaceae bacterium]|nr:histidine phosphatase family protein [Stellaceae bacterium]